MLKKDKVPIIGAILIVISLLLINNASSIIGVSEVPPMISPQVQAENEKKLEEIEQFLFGDNGIVKEVNDELVKKGYRFQTLVMANSVDDVQVKYILNNKDATESEQEAVKSIFFKIVKKNNLDANAFHLKVADSEDRPDW